jgi:hypothetical protein
MEAMLLTDGKLEIDVELGPQSLMTEVNRVHSTADELFEDQYSMEL